MEAQVSHEKSRLQAIELKVKDVEEKLNTRLPAQFRHLAALVCGAKWRLKALQLRPQEASALVKKMRLELGAFDYRVKEQAELLTRHLLELDDVLSHGDEGIKKSRKALVLFVQQLLPQADAFKERSAKLREFGEKLLDGCEAVTPAPATPSDSGSESDDLHVKALFEEEESQSEAEEEEEEEEEEEAAEDEEMQESVDVNEEEDEVMEDDENDDDEEAEEEETPQKTSPSQDLDIDVNSLPVWQPYYQLQRRQDGIYLISRLGNTDPRNVRVQWNEQNGVLRVSGFRLPTQKDIVMSRLSGAPTFGRFEIAEQFPRNMLDMEEATQQIFEDGTLQIRMPYRMVRRPMRTRPTSFFQPQDCFVW